MVRRGSLLAATMTTTATSIRAFLLCSIAAVMMLMLCQASISTAFVVLPKNNVAGSAWIGASPRQHYHPCSRTSPPPLQAIPSSLPELSSGSSSFSVTTTSSAIEESCSSSSSLHLSAAVATVDPTTFLQDLLGGVLGTPLILAIPIVAALGVASLIAFLIVAYATPAESED